MNSMWVKSLSPTPFLILSNVVAAAAFTNLYITISAAPGSKWSSQRFAIVPLTLKKSFLLRFWNLVNLL